MKMLLTLLLLLSGCSAISSREAAAGCQVMDIATTYRALHQNPDAYETNSIPINALAVIKLALAWFIMTWDGWEEADPAIRGFVTVIGCAPIPGNFRAAKQ